MIWQDIHGNHVPPEVLEKFLLKVGGKNPFGRPNYRLFHTTCRYQKQGGKWKIWAENLNTQERGGMTFTEGGIMVPTAHTPDKVEVCVKEVLKYPLDMPGWAVERWMPASNYGSQDAWERLTIPGYTGVPLLGPYPSEGDYELVSSIEPELPTETKLQELVQFQAFMDDQRLKEGLENIMLQRVTRAAEEYEAECEKARLETEAVVKDILSPWTSTSVGAGRWRQKMAERAGVKEWAGN